MEENTEKPGAQNPARVLAKRLQENRKSLHIARVPDKTKETFISLAEAEFCGDYGMTLKWLIDDIQGQDVRMIIAKVEELEARMQVIETETHPIEEVPEENSKKMLDGSKKVVKGVKKNG